jgi:hypothetical protein
MGHSHATNKKGIIDLICRVNCLLGNAKGQKYTDADSKVTPKKISQTKCNGLAIKTHIAVTWASSLNIDKFWGSWEIVA